MQNKDLFNGKMASVPTIAKQRPGIFNQADKTLLHCTFRVVDDIHQVAPVVLRGVQNAFDQTDTPHTLRNGAAVPEAARSGKLGSHGGQQHGAVVLRGDLHGLLILVLGHADVHLGHFTRAASH